MKRILCIDYGKKNLGLAFTEFLIPNPLDPLKVQDEKEAISKLLPIIKSLSLELIVVGIPDGALKGTIGDFALSLAKASGIRVTTHPETLSTKQAISKLRQSGAKKKKLANEHSFSACLILEDYLISH